MQLGFSDRHARLLRLAPAGHPREFFPVHPDRPHWSLYLTVANEAGAYEVTAHLADRHGYRSIAFAAGPAASPDSGSRFDGFRKALTERGLPAGQQPDYRGDFTTAGGRRATAAILAGPARPRAVVCANDQTAIGVLAELAGAGLRVPEDIVVTGFDGIQLGHSNIVAAWDWVPGGLMTRSGSCSSRRTPWTRRSRLPRRNPDDGELIFDFSLPMPAVSCFDLIPEGPAGNF